MRSGMGLSTPLRPTSAQRLLQQLRRHLPRVEVLFGERSGEPALMLVVRATVSSCWAACSIVEKLNRPAASGRNRLGPVCCTTAGFPLAR